MQQLQELQVRSLGREDPLEEEMAAHSSILGWEIPWAEEPSVLQSMGSQRVKYAWGTCSHACVHVSTHTCTHQSQWQKQDSSSTTRRSPSQPPRKIGVYMEGKRIQFHTFHCHIDFTSILQTDPWTTLMMPGMLMHGRRGSKDSHHGRQAGSFFLRSASNSPHSVSHHPMLRKGEFPKKTLPFPHNLLSILFLGDTAREGAGQGQGWGAPRGSHACQLEPLQPPGLSLPEKWWQEKDLTSWFFNPRSFMETAEQLSALSKLSSLQLTVESLGLALLTRQ